MKSISFLKFVDAILGKLLCMILSPKPATRCVPTTIAKILCIRPGGIGDAVLLLPTIRLLKKNYPDVRVDVLAERRNMAVFTLTTDIDRVLLYERPMQLFSALTTRYDVIIDTEQWHRLSAVVARLSRAKKIIGYSTNERKNLFTHAVPYSLDELEMESFLKLLRPLLDEVQWAHAWPFLTIQPYLLHRVRPLLDKFRNKRFVALFPGGSVKKKRWDTINFRTTAQFLAEKGYGICIIGSKADKACGSSIANETPNVIDFCGKLTIPETAALLSYASLLISGDSGIMHIAAGLGIPIVALFGPSNEKKWAPRASNVQVINKQLSCSPCSAYGYMPRCIRHEVCMRSISVAEVVARSLFLLEGDAPCR